MGTSNAIDVIRQRGFLCVSPTNLALPFPHGGTAIGITRDLEFQPGVRVREIVAEEFGGVVTDYIRTGERAALTGVLRSWDEDLLETLFADVASGATVTGGIVSGSGVVPGALCANFSLLFSARDVERNPSLLIYRAIPMPDSAARIGLAVKAEMGMPFAFMATPDSKGRLYQIGLLEDLEL